MNLPNTLTCVRIVLTFLFMFFIFSPGLLWKGGALFTFFVASLTDYWDGKIARTSGQVTNFGKLMDPIADKLLVLSAFVAFAWMGLMPPWAVMAVILRDLLITGTRLLGPASGAGWTAVGPSGKNKTAIQIFFTLGVLIYLTLRETALWREEWTGAAKGCIGAGVFIIVAVTLWSGGLYLYQNRQIFKV